MSAQRLKSAHLSMYISPELKEAAEKTAEADQRSLTSLVEKLLTDAAKEAGFWPPANVPEQDVRAEEGKGARAKARR